jgi:hypothetical protein
MPLYSQPLYTRVAGASDDIKRTFNGLEMGEGNAPNNKFLIDPRVSRKFKYQFNAKQDEWVCMPKGLIVGAATNADFNTSTAVGTVAANVNNAGEGYYFKEFESQKYYHGLTVANGGADVTLQPDQRKLDLGVAGATYTRTANVPLGVLFKNCYFKVDDQMFGAGSAVLARGFVELPYIPDRTLAANVMWGCATGGDAQANDPGYLRPGDYVKSDANGHFVKWNPGVAAVFPDASVTSPSGDLSGWILRDDPRQIVGQVWDVTGQLQPEGWLQWVMWNLDILDDTGNYQDIEKVLGLKAADLQQGAFPYGYPWLDKFHNMWRYETDPHNGRGIQGLTDGSNLLKTVTKQEVYGIIPRGSLAGEKFYFHIKPEDVVESTVRIYPVDNTTGVKIGTEVALGATYDNAVPNINFVFERFQKTEGLIVVTLGENSPAADDVKLAIDYDAYGMIPGVPTLWDLKGSVGAVRINLGGLGK